MTTAALIVAAGKKEQDSGIRAMDPVGSISAIQRIIATFRQAGVDRVVVITGYKGDELEHHLSGKGIIFLRNPDYSQTQMIHSVKLGLSYLRGKCDRILFTPADIPLFTPETVRELLRVDQPVVCPVNGERRGHPLQLWASLIDAVLQDTGEGGLQGVLDRLGCPVTLLSVTDGGILDEVQQLSDYRTLVEEHSQQLIRPVVDVSLVREKVFLDPQLALLLALIRQTGSVRTACQQMKLSYSGSWNRIKTLETQLKTPLIQRNQGGTGGGRSRLTAEGEQLLERYQAYRMAIKKAGDELFTLYFEDFF